MYFWYSKDERILSRSLQCFSINTEVRSSNEREEKEDKFDARFEEQKECGEQKGDMINGRK